MKNLTDSLNEIAGSPVFSLNDAGEMVMTVPAGTTLQDGTVTTAPSSFTIPKGRPAPAGRPDDKARLDWLQAQLTLHRTVAMLYVVDGYIVQHMEDGDEVSDVFKGATLADAIDAAMRQPGADGTVWLFD